MFLKKIISSGFKSFADRVVINLDRGITGVVGPNGSGKSNIIDSVRWVMGEQNAKNLRGDKATDIIFSGSERRKPLSMAEVSLVFDNTEGSAFCPPEYRHEPEIAITRRMYADGQREYLINKKPCRLKDIVGFFALTGLGGKNYSMIQQGQVDRILQSKPEDIREMLESAAGTIIYKKRKHEAERKLEQTQLNLSRIDDILSEVDKSLESLINQVEKAKKYKEYSAKLKEDEMSLFTHNYHRFKDELTSLKSEAEEKQNREIAIMADSSGLENQHAELQAQLDDADPDIQRLQEKISVMRETIARSEAVLKSANDLLENGDKRLADIDEELAEDDSNLKVLEGQVDAAQKELSDAERIATELQGAIETFASEMEQADEAARVYQSRIEEFEDEIRNLERLIEANKLKNENIERDIEKNTRELAEQRDRKRILEEEMIGAADDVGVAEKAAAGKKDGLDQEIKEKHDREAQVATNYNRMKELSRHRDELKESYHESKARYASLAELTSGATDVAGVIKEIREAGVDVDEMILGLLTDHISFTDAADELPQKARKAFESWAEQVIVKDLAAFNDLVRAAHQHGNGTMPVSVLSEAEAIDTAAAAAWADQWDAQPIKEFVRVENSSPMVEGFLQRLYLLQTLGLDDNMIQSLPRGVIVFTAQGVSFSKGSEFVVGSKSADGILSRKIELEELASKLKGVENDLSRSQSEIDSLEMQINDDRQVIAEIDTRLQSQNQDVLEVMSALQAAQQIADRKQELIDTAAALIEKFEHNEIENQEALKSLEESRESLQVELNTARGELESIEEESSSLIERKDESRKLHDAKKIEAAKSEARAQALRDSFLMTRSQLQLLQNKLSRRYEEKARIENDIEKAKVEVVQAKTDIEGAVREREGLETEYKSKREENAHIVEELRVVESKLKKFRDEQHEIQKALSKLDVALERVKLGMEGAAEQAMEKYRVDLSDYEFERDENFNPENRTRSVQRLRAKIESLGNINMMALQEYEEKSERSEFMKAQRDEVLSSIALLETAITEIEETSVRKFQETFELINTEFGNLFPILFPGGEGKLELMNAENPLDAGVEILCRLPGKSMKAMSLFSGGEKALTAISLIFAMLKTKPTPFCFLDEVDAPLDETNVGRYNKVLEALAQQFQFIVITHNRRTMEVLDTLYGITMQEPGVSKVVGVDMQRDLPPHLRKAFKEGTATKGAKPAEATAH